MYLTSRKVKTILLIVAGALVVLIAFGGVFQAVTLYLSKGVINFSKTSFQDKIAQLNQEKLLYQLRLTQLKNLSEENRTLREALNFKKREELSLVGAEIIAFSPSSWHKYVFLNAGEKNNVAQGMLVVDKNGYLMGKVTEVYRDRCKVILIKNPDFQTPVLINNKVSGLLQGSLSGIEVLYIEEGEKIDIGDLVYTTLSPFDSSVKVGKVSRVRKIEDSLFYQVRVDTSSEDRLSRVAFIVK